MPNMNPSMTTAIMAPISSAMKTRCSLQRIWASSKVFRYVTAYMTAMAVRIMAPNRKYIRMSLEALEFPFDVPSWIEVCSC